MESKYYKWSKNGMKMIIDSGYKLFDKQTNDITTGNAITNTQYSSIIRPYSETECNGQKHEKGYLTNYDLQYFSIPNWLRKEIIENDRKICLYEFRTYRNGIKNVIGWLVEDNGNIKTIVNNNSLTLNTKKYKALELCKNIIEEHIEKWGF